MNFEIVTTENFNGVSCNFYSDDGQIFMTRNQIGNALGYNDPNRAIKDIHMRHKERLDKFSRVAQIAPTSKGGTQEAYLYSQRGVFEICRWSQQQKADAFMDWVWDIVEAYRSGTLQPTRKPLAPQNDFSTLCVQVNGIEETLDNFYDRLNALEEAMSHTRPQTTLAYIGMEQKPIIDPIRDNIERLAVLYEDGSNGYNVTFRKVYLAMGVDWKNRRTRFRNKKGNKTPPSNIQLIENDKKLLKLFLETVENMIFEAESNR